MKKFLLFTLWCFYQMSLVLSQSDLDTNRIVGYDTTAFNPLYLQLKGGLLKLHLGAYAQLGYNYYSLENVPDGFDNTDASFTGRAQIQLDGQITERFNFNIRTNIIRLVEAYLQWNINKKTSIRLGQLQMALGREDMILLQNLASIEHSMHNYKYGMWSGLGVEFHRQGERLRSWAGVSNGILGNKYLKPTKNLGYALTGRMEAKFFESDWSDWDNTLGKINSGFSILAGVGATYYFNKIDITTNYYNYGYGGYGYYNYSGPIIYDENEGYQLNVDLSMNGDRFHFFSQFSWMQWTNSNYNTTISAYAFNTTMGYWLGRKVFTYAKVNYLPKGNGGSSNEDFFSNGLGLSYFPVKWSRRYRVSLEFNTLNNNIYNTVARNIYKTGFTVDHPCEKQNSVRLFVQLGF